MDTTIPFKISKPLASSFRKGCSRKRRRLAQIVPLKNEVFIAAQEGSEVKDDDGIEDIILKKRPWGVELLDSDEESEFRKQRLLAAKAYKEAQEVYEEEEIIEKEEVVEENIVAAEEVKVRQEEKKAQKEEDAGEDEHQSMIEEEVIDTNNPIDAHVCDNASDDGEIPPFIPMTSQSGSSEEIGAILAPKTQVLPSTRRKSIAKTPMSPSKPKRGEKRKKRITVIEISDSDEDFETPRKSTKPFDHLKIAKVRSPPLVRRAVASYRNENKADSGKKVPKRPRSPIVIDLEDESPVLRSSSKSKPKNPAQVKREIKMPPLDQDTVEIEPSKKHANKKTGAKTAKQDVDEIAPRIDSADSQLKIKKPVSSKQQSGARKTTGVFERLMAQKRKRPSNLSQRSQTPINVSKTSLEQDTTTCLQASQQSTEAPRKKVYHLHSFEYVMNAMLSRHRHLLRKEDTRSVETFKALSENAQRLFVRLYRRKLFKWFRLDDLERNYVKEIDVNAAIQELSTMGVITVARTMISERDEQKKRTAAREILSTLKLHELRDAAKSQWDRDRLNKTKRAPLELEFKNRLKKCATSETGRKVQPLQKTIDGSSSELLLAVSILKLARKCVRLKYRHVNAFKRIHFLFFLEDGADSPRALLAYAGRTKFAMYYVPQRFVSPLFRSLTSLKAYEYARSLEFKLEAAQEARREDDAVAFGNTAERELQKFYASHNGRNHSSAQHFLSQIQIETADILPERLDLVSRESIHTSVDNSTMWSSDAGPQLYRETRKQLQHPFLRRFTSVWVYARTAWHSISTLEKKKDYVTAVARLKLLLQTGLCPLRHGKWINRLTIDLERHLKEKSEAYDLCVETLRNATRYIHIGDKIALAKRAEKLHRCIHRPRAEQLLKPEAKTKKELKALVDDHLEKNLDPAIRTVLRNRTKVPERQIHGKALPKLKQNGKEAGNSSGRLPWKSKSQETDEEEKRNPTGVKSMFASFTNKTMAVSVEQLVLEVYAAEGWKGMHCEGAAIRFLFTVLMWDVLFMDVDDVFQTPFQNAPLDLQTEAFYISRKSAIEERLGRIKNMSNEELKEEIETCYKENTNTTVIGGQWDRFSLEDTVSLAVCIGGRTLEKTCHLLATDYGYWRGGFPDLVLWKMKGNDDGTGCEGGVLEGQAKFVEVKSERDSLSERQSAWIRELVDSGADAEMCKVKEKDKSGNGDVDGYGIELIEKEYQYVDLDI